MSGSGTTVVQIGKSMSFNNDDILDDRTLDNYGTATWDQWYDYGRGQPAHHAEWRDVE